jgi:hypothetical protein
MEPDHTVSLTQTHAQGIFRIGRVTRPAVIWVASMVVVSSHPSRGNPTMQLHQRRIDLEVSSRLCASRQESVSATFN